MVSDRAFCQIKTFCDKGAERKAREEERRLSVSSRASSADRSAEKRTISMTFPYTPLR